MADTPQEALAEALSKAIHAVRWCKWNDTLHTIAHDPSPETPSARYDLVGALLEALPPGWVLAREQDAAEALSRLDGLVVICSPWEHSDRWLVRVYDHDADEDDGERLYGEGATLPEAIAALEEVPDPEPDE